MLDGPDFPERDGVRVVSKWAKVVLAGVAAAAVGGLALVFFPGAFPFGGSVATWKVDDSAPPDPSARSFAALVSRLECANGKTGKVRNPEVTETNERVVVTFTAAPLRPGGYDCQDNDYVKSTVRLDDELGQRELVDGACLGGKAVTTSVCADGPLRWP